MIIDLVDPKDDEWGLRYDSDVVPSVGHTISYSVAIGHIREVVVTAVDHLVTSVVGSEGLKQTLVTCEVRKINGQRSQ